MEDKRTAWWKVLGAYGAAYVVLTGLSVAFPETMTSIIQAVGVPGFFLYTIMFVAYEVWKSVNQPPQRK